MSTLSRNSAQRLGTVRNEVERLVVVVWAVMQEATVIYRRALNLVSVLV